MSWLESPYLPIGIDIGAHSLRMIQLRRARGGLSLQAAARIDRGAVSAEAPGATLRATLAQVIRETIRSGGFKGRRCVLALSPTLVHSRSVRLPPMPDGDMSQAVVWEVKDRFGFEPEAGAVTFFRAGEVRRGSEVREEVLVFAAPSKLLRETLLGLMEEGLTVPAIDLQPCAALRAVARTMPMAGTIGLMDMGGSGTQFVVLQNGRPVFYKHIEIGATALDGAITQKLGVTPAEAAQMRDRLACAGVDAGGPGGAELPAALGQAVHDAMRPKLEELARELDMCMRYHVITFRAARPETIVAVGRQASHERMLETLGSALGMTVAAGLPLANVQALTAATRPDRSAEWATATGLSLYPCVARSAEAA